MKKRIFIGVLLIFCAQCAHSALDGGSHDYAKVRDKHRKWDEQIVAKTFNELRRRVADKYQIANMQETVYDKEYEKLLTQAGCHIPKGDFFFIGNAEEQLKLVLMRLTEPNPKVTTEDKIHFNPKKNRIACRTLSSQCKHVFISGCIIGPGSTSSDSDFIRGTPGSKCPNGKASISGLCAFSAVSSDGSSDGSSDANEGLSIGGYSSALILVVLAFVNLF